MSVLPPLVLGRPRAPPGLERLRPSSPGNHPLGLGPGSGWGVLTIWYMLDSEEAKMPPYPSDKSRLNTSPDRTPGGNYIPPADRSGVTPGVVHASEKPGSRTRLL